MLKLQKWLLHTDGAEQHKVFSTGFLCYLQGVQSSLVVYCPGVFLQDQEADCVQFDACKLDKYQFLLKSVQFPELVMGLLPLRKGANMT